MLIRYAGLWPKGGEFQAVKRLKNAKGANKATFVCQVVARPVFGCLCVEVVVW